MESAAKGPRSNVCAKLRQKTIFCPGGGGGAPWKWNGFGSGMERAVTKKDNRKSRFPAVSRQFRARRIEINHFLSLAGTFVHFVTYFGVNTAHKETQDKYKFFDPLEGECRSLLSTEGTQATWRKPQGACLGRAMECRRGRRLQDVQSSKGNSPRRTLDGPRHPTTLILLIKQICFGRLTI